MRRGIGEDVMRRDTRTFGTGVFITRLPERCADADKGCFECSGSCPRKAALILRRVDMEDTTGTAFCAPCAQDALQTGLYQT
jgi:hypothetical protein